MKITDVLIETQPPIRSTDQLMSSPALQQGIFQHVNAITNKLLLLWSFGNFVVIPPPPPLTPPHPATCCIFLKALVTVVSNALREEMLLKV